MRRDIRLEVSSVDHAGPAGRPAAIAFSLSYQGTEPGTVAEVANALAGLYVQENLALRERRAAGTSDFLRGQLAELRAKLEEQERQVGQPLTTETDLAALERLNTRLRINSDRQLRIMDRRERLLRAGAVPDPLDPEAPGETAHARLAKLKQDLAELTTRFSDRYPDVIHLKAEIAALERQVERAPRPAAPAARPRAAAPAADRSSPAEIAAELRALRDEEATLRQSIATYERRVESAPQRQQEYQRRARDYATLKEQYQSLLRRYEDAHVAEGLEQDRKGDQFRVLDAAIPSRDPVAPNRLRLALMGLMLSLGAAVGVTVLAERLDTSFHTREDLRAFTRVPILATIPPIVTRGDARRRRWRAWLAGASVAASVAVVATGTSWLARDNDWLLRILARLG
jgi:polysaccharide chain length determinant protein (PEP-CTERM system associated)